MIKSLNSLRKMVILSVMALSMTVFNPHLAQAACMAAIEGPVTGTTGAISTLTSTVTGQITTMVAGFQLLTQQLVLVVTGLTTAVHKAAEAESKSFQNALQTKHTMETEREKRLVQAELDRNNRVSKSACINATARQHVPEMVVIKKAAARLLKDDLVKAYSLTGSQLSPSTKTNSIAYQSDIFRFIMANFCNPSSNGGLMPTQANPIVTASGPLWCGMGRTTTADAMLMDFHLNFPEFLLNPSRFANHPKLNQAMEVSTKMLIGFPMDKIDLASLDTAAAQRAFNQRMARETQKMLSGTFISDVISDRVPSANNQASEWVREIHKYNKGENPPQALIDYIDKKYGGNLSYSQFLEAMVDYNTGPQHNLDTTAISQGQFNQEMLNLQSLHNYLKSKRLKQSEITNVFSAAIYASGS